MRILVLGSGGQLGTALQSALAREDLLPLTHADLDVADPGAVEAAVRKNRPDVVINAAAWNFVDRAEEEPAEAFAINALSVRNVALACRAAGAALVHVSTDYVFGGPRETPWTESDLPQPAGVYAVSKLAGEHFARSGCERSYIVRTCGLYGRAARGGKGNFVETMLRLGRERGEVSVVDDQWCTPTAAADLAQWIAALLGTGRCGVYHATNSGATTWRRFAEEIFRQAGMPVAVRAITTAQFGAKAPRPAYSVLDTSLLAATIGAAPRPWQEALGDYLRERGALDRG